MSRQKDFAKRFPEHRLVTDNVAFARELSSETCNDDTKQYAAYVLIDGWEFIDDNGDPFKFSPKAAYELLNAGHGIGDTITRQVLYAVFDKSLYNINWESVVVKNS